MILGAAELSPQAKITQAIGVAAKRMIAQGIPTAERVRRLKVLRTALEAKYLPKPKPPPAPPAPRRMSETDAVRFATSKLAGGMKPAALVDLFEKKGFSRADGVRFGTAAQKILDRQAAARARAAGGNGAANGNGNGAGACNIFQRIYRFFGGEPDCT